MVHNINRMSKDNLHFSGYALNPSSEDLAALTKQHSEDLLKSQPKGGKVASDNAYDVVLGSHRTETEPAQQPPTEKQLSDSRTSEYSFQPDPVQRNNSRTSEYSFQPELSKSGNVRLHRRDSSPYSSTPAHAYATDKEEVALARAESYVSRKTEAYSFEESSDSVQDEVATGKPLASNYLRDGERLRRSTLSFENSMDVDMTVFNWNEKFQSKLEDGEPPGYEKWRALQQMEQQFSETAEAYARIIISERALPPEAKTIKPINVGGVAGGEKFVVQGIFFKFALDVELVPGHWMYGGTERNDENAVSAAAKELSALEYFSVTQQSLFHFPLMAVIDFKGFRVVAVSVVPIDKSTLVYGSSDGGQHVYNSDPEVANAVKAAAESLNLTKHLVSNKLVEIYGPGDIEIHRGDDGRVYCLDLARLFPPESPSPDDERSIFYKFLRPELVMSNPKALCSDAFSAWNRFDPNQAVHRKDIEEATHRLRTVVVPQAAQELSTLRIPTEFHKHHDVVDQYDEIQLMTRIHRHGVNLRYLGAIIAAMPKNQHSKGIRRLLRYVAAARALKSVIRQRMRHLMEKIHIAADEPFKELIVTCLNSLTKYDTTEAAQQFMNSFYDTIKRKYGLDWKTEVAQSMKKHHTKHHMKFNLADVICLSLELLGIKMNHSVLQAFYENPQEYEFLSADISDLNPMSKHTYQHNLYEGCWRFLKSLNTSRASVKRRLLEDSQNALLLGCSRVPLCPVQHFMVANSYVEMALLLNNTKESTVMFEKAYENYQLSCRGSDQWFNRWSSPYNNLAAAMFDHSAMLLNEGKKKQAHELKMQAAHALQKARALEEVNSCGSSCQLLNFLSTIYYREVSEQGGTYHCSVTSMSNRLKMVFHVQTSSKTNRKQRLL